MWTKEPESERGDGSKWKYLDQVNSPLFQNAINCKIPHQNLVCSAGPLQGGRKFLYLAHEV